jgi:serine/threonine protein kinase
MEEQVKSVGQFQLGDCIGKGAFGAVYRGLNSETGEVVAIKQVKMANIPKSEITMIMVI